jgi:hypothetical protein
MFEDTFKLTQAAPNPRSAIEALALPGARPRTPGVYANGLIVLVSDDFDMSCFEGWPPITAERFAILGYTAQGDFLLWDYKKNIMQFFETERARLTKCGDTIDAVLDGRFLEQEIIDSVLVRPSVEAIVAAKGPLRYGDCYIHAPLAMFGGNEKPENCSTGDVRVYVNMIGQNHFGSGKD